MMDSFELNKLIGALLAVVFVLFSVSIVSDAIFKSHAPEVPGYAIEVAEAEPDTGGEAEADAGPTVMDLLATADPAAGQSVFRACAACHTVDQGGANRTGPNLWDVVNRPVASKEGFNYSPAMREFSQGGAVAWDYEHLSEFLKAPRSYVSGTSMAFAGVRSIEQEANLIAYLRTLSENPAPLPAASAEEAPAEDAPVEEAPAEEAPAEEAPAEEAPAEEAPAEEAPVEEAPVEEEPAE